MNKGVISIFLDILFWIAVISALMAALYFAITGRNFVYSFCYVVAAGLLLSTKHKDNDK